MLTRLSLILAFVTALVSLPTQAQPRVALTPIVHEDSQLRVPEGWTQHTNSQGALLLTSPSGDAQIHLRVRPYSPGLDAEAAVSGVLDGSAAYDVIQRIRSDSGEGLLVVARLRNGSSQAAVLVDPDAERGVTILAAFAAAPDRFEALGGAALLATITNSIAPLARTQTTSARSTPSTPRTPPQGSVQQLVAMYLQPLNPATGSGGWRIRMLTLFPDGSFYGGPLALSPDAIDPAVLQREDPQRFGTWRRDGSTLQLHYTGLAGTRYEHITLQREGKGWRRSRNQLFLAPQPLHSSRIQGHFVSTQNRTVGVYTGAPVVSAAASSDFWFHSNGRFERSHGTGISGRGAGVGTATGRKGGTYTLSGTTLTLHHEDGEVQRLPLYAWPGSDAIVIGARRFERQ
ncbi:MAG: hypothetical protein AAF170_13905 [Bacteroidota bacterium]